jgi:hypothetical protein
LPEWCGGSLFLLIRIAKKGDLVMAEPDASSTVKGITKLSLDPVSATSPIAVGDNDARVNEYNAAAYASFSDAVDAVAAVSGTNKLVISTPISVGSSKTVPADVILVFVSGGMLTVTSGTVTILGEIRAKADKIFSFSGHGGADISAATFDECYFEWYGITSGSDNITAIQSLLIARKTSFSTRIRMLPGIVYSFATPLAFSECNGISLVGGGGSEHNPTAELRYTGSGSLSAMKFYSTHGFTAESVKFSYTSNSFAGYLIDIDWADQPSDAAYNHFRNCQFTGTETAYGALALVSANRTIISTFEQCLFFHALKGISGAKDNLNKNFTVANLSLDTLTVTAHGLKTGDLISLSSTGTLPAPLSPSPTLPYHVIVVDANTIQVAVTRGSAEAGSKINITDSGSGTHTITAGGYSYVIKLDSNTFVDVGLAIYNPDQCWTIINNTFEPTRTDMSGGILNGELRVMNGQGGNFGDVTPRVSWNMVFSGNWIGDVSPTASTYAAVHLQGALGAVISGNLFYGAGGTSGQKITAIELSSCQGVMVEANRIEGWDRAITYSGNYNYGVSYLSNDTQCVVNLPYTVSGGIGSTETRIGNSGMTSRITHGFQVVGSPGTTPLPGEDNSILFGSIVTGSVDRAHGAAIRSTYSVSGYPEGSLVIQPRTADTAADVVFITLNTEPFRITDTGVKIGQGTAISKVLRGTVSVNPSSVAANSVSTQTVTITGAATGDSVVLNPPAAGLTAGLLVTQVRVSAADTVSVTYYNTTGSAIDEGSGTWNYLLVR